MVKGTRHAQVCARWRRGRVVPNPLQSSSKRSTGTVNRKVDRLAPRIVGHPAESTEAAGGTPGTGTTPLGSAGSGYGGSADRATPLSAWNRRRPPPSGRSGTHRRSAGCWRLRSHRTRSRRDDGSNCQHCQGREASGVMHRNQWPSGGVAVGIGVTLALAVDEAATTGVPGNATADGPTAYP
jgi:hypothetical protein